MQRYLAWAVLATAVSCVFWLQVFSTVEELLHLGAWEHICAHFILWVGVVSAIAAVVWALVVLLTPKCMRE